MSPLRLLHLAVGAVALALFLLSGQYMHFAYDHLRDLPDGPRLMFRTSHIYLLWSALLNLLLGVHLHRAPRGLPRHLQIAASLALLLGPLLIAISFLTESFNPDLNRPLVRQAIYLALLGTVLHLVAGLGQRAKPPTEHPPAA